LRLIAAQVVRVVPTDQPSAEAEEETDFNG